MYVCIYIYETDHMWPTKPKILLVSSEKVCQPLDKTIWVVSVGINRMMFSHPH